MHHQLGCYGKIRFNPSFDMVSCGPSFLAVSDDCTADFVRFLRFPNFLYSPLSGQKVFHHQSNTKTSSSSPNILSFRVDHYDGCSDKCVHQDEVLSEYIADYVGEPHQPHPESLDSCRKLVEILGTKECHQRLVICLKAKELR